MEFHSLSAKESFMDQPLGSLARSWKIDSKKILELRDANVKLANEDDVNILHILDWKESADAVNLLRNLELKIRNVFVFIISFSGENYNRNNLNQIFKDLQGIIIEKFTKKNSFVLQINLGSCTFSYVYKVSYEKLREVKLETEFLRDKFSSDILLSLLKCSLNQADFVTVLNFFNINEINLKVFNLAIDSGDELSLRLLKLFDFDFIDSNQTEILSAIVQSKNFKLFLSFFNAFDESQVLDEDIERVLRLSMNEKNQSMFILALESKNNEILRFLLSFSTKFQWFFNFELFKNSLNVIIEKEFFEFLSVLEKTNFNFSEEEVALKDKEIKNCDMILKEIMKLHQNISKGEVKEIENFVENFPNLRLCYGDLETCALTWSIFSNKFEIYSYLRSKGFYSDKGEELEREISKLSMEEKNLIRKNNLKYAIKNPEEFIGILLSKCCFDSQSPIASNDVREMLLNFKKHPEIHSMIKTVSYAKFKTMFDFNSLSVRTMDPNGDEFTLGLAYFEQGILYVGKNANKNQRYGTFAHELTHYGLYLIYENRCLPYCKGDNVKKDKWKVVVEKVRLNYENNPETTDNIIKWVFMCYEPGYQYLAETAVRVNDMLGYYYNNPAKINELELQHPELFDFYRTEIQADFEIPNVYRMIKLNNDFGLLNKIQNSAIQVVSKNIECLSFINENNRNIFLRSNVPHLTFSMLLNEISSLPGNKLNLKAQNLFIECKELNQKNLNEEFEELVEDGTVQRIIINANSDSSTLQKILKHPGNKFIILNQSFADKMLDDKNLVIKPINHLWDDLTDSSKKLILNKEVKFRNSTFKVSKLFANPDQTIVGEIFTVLCQNETIAVECHSETNVPDNYIDRSIEKKRKVLRFKDGKQVEEIELDSCLLKNFVLKETKDDPVVIISDIAGSGKSTILRKIQEMILENFPSAFVLFLNLKSYIPEFAKVGNDFFQEICRILKFDDLKRKIFFEKYKLGEVRIFFDGFDEISPNCKETVLKLFKIFLLSEPEQKNKIYVTTRTHLEYDLEICLSVIGHKLEALKKDQQIQFLANSWIKSNRRINPAFITICAEMLVEKISKISNVIGLPLIVEGFIKIYKEKIDSNFDNEIKSLTITKIFEKIFETNFSVLLNRYPEKNLEYFQKSAGIMNVLKKHAIVHHFDEVTASELSLIYDEDEWTLEGIVRAGIAKYERNNKFEFNHETSAEYLTGLVVFENLKNYGDLSETKIKVFISVLREEKFKITRMFLNEMIENSVRMKCFGSSKKICNVIFKLGEPKNILDYSSAEGLSNIFRFTLNLIKNSDLKLYEDILMGSDDHSTPLTTILSKISDESFQEVLSEVLSVDEIAKKLLSLEHGNKESLYSTVASYGSPSSLNIFFNKITQVLGNNEWKNIFTKKIGPLQRTMITNVIVNKSHLDSIKILWEIHQEKMSVEEFLDILNEKDHEDRDFFEYLTIELLNSTDIFDLVWPFMRDTFAGLRNISEFYFQKGFMALCESVANKNEEAFIFLYEQVMCKYFNLNDLILHKIEDREIFFHYFACHGTPLILQFGLMQLKNNIENFNDILKIKNADMQNFVHLLGIQKQDILSVEFLLNYIKGELDNEELKEILRQPDVSNFLPLHFMLYSTSECFRALFLVYEENFDEAEIKAFLRSKVQILRAEQPLTIERNIFEITRTYTFEDSVARTFKELTERYE